MLIAQNSVKVAVLVSGNGTNLQALINAQSTGKLGQGKIVKVISSKAGAYALTRAEKAGIDTEVIERKIYNCAEDFDNAILSALLSCRAELVVLAGFMCILGEKVIKSYNNKIINVHPALIPSFCGIGYYGLRVHEEALKKGVKISGATVHFVNEIPDGGKIILQKAVEVFEDDTPSSLQQRVMEQAEWEILPKAVAMICQNVVIGSKNDCQNNN
jgi:phosphoribosylglycinamide formyltransferase 1